MDLEQIIDAFLPAAVLAYDLTAPCPAGFGFYARILSKDGEDFGVVLFDSKSKTALVAIRGTEDLEDWLHDLDAVPVPIAGDGPLVHKGFLDATDEIWPGVRDLLMRLNPEKVLITGHSLGAAMAVQCAYTLAIVWPVTVCTFAGPRVGSPEFVREFNSRIPNCTRVVNAGDVVPNLPTEPPYAHVGAELAVEGGSRLLDVAFAHSLDQYRAGLEKLAPAITH